MSDYSTNAEGLTRSKRKIDSINLRKIASTKSASEGKALSLLKGAGKLALSEVLASKKGQNENVAAFTTRTLTSTGRKAIKGNGQADPSQESSHRGRGKKLHTGI